MNDPRQLLAMLAASGHRPQANKMQNAIQMLMAALPNKDRLLDETFPGVMENPVEHITPDLLVTPPGESYNDTINYSPKSPGEGLHGVYENQRGSGRNQRFPVGVGGKKEDED